MSFDDAQKRHDNMEPPEYWEEPEREEEPFPPENCCFYCKDADKDSKDFLCFTTGKYISKDTYFNKCRDFNHL